MRKYIKANGTFYYPEEHLSLIDTEELKIIVENPVGYAEGDLVRMFYTYILDKIQVGVNTFEMFSPLVKDGSILRAIFYLPLSAEFANDSISFNPHLGETVFYIKTKGSTDFDIYTNRLDANSSYIYLMNSNQDVRSNPIPVFFFSERGAGLFANKILNRQSWAADTNFSSVAIRQDKFNPFDTGVEGRNLFFKTSFIHRLTGWGTSFPRDIEHSNDTPSEILGVESVSWTVFDTAQGGIYQRFRSPDGLTNVEYFKAGQIYTVSCWVKGSRAGTFRVAASGIANGTKTINVTTEWKKHSLTFVGNGTSNIITFFGYDNDGSVRYSLCAAKLEEGSIATAYTPAPEDYEVTEVISGADLAGGLDKFNSSYAFKLLDDSEWVVKKLVCPENYIQLFWGEPRTETRFSFWFKIKEIEKSSEAWGEVEHYRELRAGTDVKERRKDVTKYRFPKTKLRLSSGVFRQDIIDKLKGIAHSTTIFKYNPYTKLNEGRGVVAQVTEVRDANEGIPVPQVGVGHFRLNDFHTDSNTIEELINSPESVFDLEFSFKGTLRYVDFIQNRDESSKYVTISNTITESNFTKKTFNGSIVIDRSRKVKPMIRFGVLEVGTTEIKDIYIKGSLGGIEDVEVEIATMNIIPHQDGESEMELTVISDDFRKPDYLYF